MIDFHLNNLDLSGQIDIPDLYGLYDISLICMICMIYLQFMFSYRGRTVCFPWHMLPGLDLCSADPAQPLKNGG